MRALADNIDCRFQAFKGRFDEIADRLDALAIGADRNRNNDRRQPRDDVVEGQPINRLVPAPHHRQPIYSDDLEEEEDILFANHQPIRGSGRYVRDHERNSGDFIL